MIPGARGAQPAPRAVRLRSPPLTSVLVIRRPALWLPLGKVNADVITFETLAFAAYQLRQSYIHDDDADDGFGTSLSDYMMKQFLMAMVIVSVWTDKQTGWEKTLPVMQARFDAYAENSQPGIGFFGYLMLIGSQQVPMAEYPGGMSLAMHDDLLVEIAVIRKLAERYARQIVDINADWGFDE